ncbi:hypothetical protein J4E86_007170 [Alternaria arbusti]|uniref:uncharacterized protein n=1 Tax=Alternaria arbusti TaxID=232088 RepID=UPI00221F8F3D|nr:uncharacterized protein J4E86_007170 [Alternaria arbusti]KAI4951754.1 hypothetical protein J4E86_007170 [Alternaria arbusti]
MEPEAPIRGLKIIFDFMEQISKPVHSSSFNVGDLVDMIVAEPTTDQGVHERSEDHLVNTNYGIFVIKSRPGIVVEKFEEYCMVAELGRRNNRILDGLSLMGLIERMGVLPSDAAPFDLATLSEDHELYRLIYDPVRVAENVGRGDTASDDVTGTVQTLSSMTAPTAAKFVATSSIHPDRRPSMEVSALIQAIEQDSRIACESASMQIIPIQVARDIARIEWEEMANDADLFGVNLPSKKRKLDEITKLHKEADSQSMGPMTILRGIKRLKQKVRGSILSDEDSRTEAMHLYSELDSVTTGMEKLQAKSTLFLDRD